MSINNKRLTTNEFILKANLIHNNKYDYSKVFYINNHTKVCIICPDHQEFWQMPSNHLHQKQGCPKCCNTFKYDYIEFINRANIIHNNKYDYSLINENNFINHKTKVPIICPDHGIFYQNPNNHLHGQGCPNCIFSKGELLITEYLQNNKINFIPQYQFERCRNKRILSFDFYLPETNTCIEFDGKQHYKPFGFGENSQEKFQRTQINDSIKTQYCIDNNIKLIRIPYWKSKSYLIMEQFLNSFITPTI